MSRARSPQPVRAGTKRMVHALDIDALLDDRSTEIVVCCGSGGVGKTTISAAIALRAAQSGRRVCVLTIDPARRLAQALGLGELDNTPREVVGAGARGGRLDAMMLDMKRTFDEVVEAHATADKAAQILSNPFYIALSSSFAGTQEYMAMEKLGQLHAQSVSDDSQSRRWDLIVVDTPPSRSALDFLDAPERLSSLLDGKFIKLLLTPARGPARVMTAGFGVVTRALNRLIGAQVLTDVQTFVAAFDTLFGGFRMRAENTYSLLKADQTSFLVVASPEPDAMREATYFVERLGSEGMPLTGLIVNRTSPAAGRTLSIEDAEAGARTLSSGDLDEQTAAELLNLHAASMRTAAREARLKRGFVAAHPTVRQVSVPALAEDVNDVDGLREIGRQLAAGRV